MPFIINNDLWNINFNWHNKIHFFGEFLLSALCTYYALIGFVELMLFPIWFAVIASLYVGFSCAWVLGIIWDLGDGLKPHYKEGYGKPWIVQQLFYSDYCSMQDIFVWDLFGALLGSIFGLILYAAIIIY